MEKLRGVIMVWGEWGMNGKWKKLSESGKQLAADGLPNLLTSRINRVRNDSSTDRMLAPRQYAYFQTSDHASISLLFIFHSFPYEPCISYHTLLLRV